MTKDEETQKIIKDRLNKFRSRRGYIYSKLYPDYPLRMRKLDEVTIIAFLENIEKNLRLIKDLIKSIRKSIPNIWDQTNIAAVYFLLCKSFSNLETVIELAKKGHNFEIIELSRSAIESLDLAFLFLEDGEEELLKKWFDGKIIENDKSRKAFQRATNKFIEESSGSTKVDLPIEDLKRKVYKIYSSYTHSSYAALLDMVDVFQEDFDFDRYAGFHYVVINLHLIRNLIYSILLGLKNIFNKYKDQQNLAKVENLLKTIGFEQPTQEEIKDVIKKYSKSIR